MLNCSNNSKVLVNLFFFHVFKFLRILASRLNLQFKIIIGADSLWGFPITQSAANFKFPERELVRWDTM